MRRLKPDYVLLETGMGGRLDSTNVVKPLVSVITSIALDHVAFLGTTIGEVAEQKAGIIKGDTPVVVGQRLKGSLGKWSEKLQKRKDSPLLSYGNEFVMEKRRE